MANQRVYILDDHRQPVPPGVPGELYLAGTGLARGYLGRPEWTAERFIEWSHPWSGGSERLYRTGDRARFGADGLIELLGRADFQIKINGLRIEPGEIEAVLRDHPAVRKVVVSARDGRLIAHVVPVPGTALDGTALDGLRDHALTRLPEYQVPAAFVPLDDLPLTPNGKVDRRALPDPDLAGSAYRAPRSAVEKVLADAWTQVLGITRVGIDDDFIAIGGDSIRAAQAVTRARAAGVGVTARQILQLRTIATIAPSAGSVAPTGVPAPGPLVGVGADEMAALNRRYPRLAEVWPLTPMQSGMLFESLVNENTYLLQVVYHLSGPVDPGRLRAAARALPDRHAALRAGFVIDVAEEPVQVVLDRVDPPWREVDLSDVSDGAQEKAFERFLADDRSRRVDPDAPPLLRFSLVTLGAQRARLVLTAHHLLIDGWSEQVLAGDLLRLYAGGPAEPARPFRDFLVWSARQDPGRAAAAWAAELAGLDAPTVLAPAPAGGSAGGSAGIVEVAVPLQTGGFGRAAELGVTANTVAQAAWAIVLAALTGRQDVVFGATTAGRPGELTDAGSMVGLFINTVPVRVLVDPRRSVKDLVTDLQNRQAGLLEHQHLGLTEIHRVVGVDRLFDTMVAFQSFPTHRSTGGDVEITGIDSVGVGSYPMSLLVEGDRLTVQYDRSVFDHDVVTTIAGCYRSVVRQLVSGDPDRCVDMIDGLPRTMATGRSAAAAVGAVGAYRAGRTAREVALCEAFADVLGIDRVGIDDDFFALGCNSLKATRIIGRIRRTLGIEVSISSIFQYSTVARLSGRLPTTPARPGLRRMVPDISVRSENGDD